MTPYSDEITPILKALGILIVIVVFCVDRYYVAKRLKRLEKKAEINGKLLDISTQAMIAATESKKESEKKDVA